MLRTLIFLLATLSPTALFAGEPAQLVETAINTHILPAFQNLSTTTETLKQAADTDCSPDSQTLRTAYHTAFDAWLGASHLRFGPTEAEDRAFGLAFWPDTKGFTPKTLTRLIQTEDTTVTDPARFATVSIAGRGFFALEFMLFDDRLRQTGHADYRCTLIHAIASDIDRIADAILLDWQQDYADKLRTPGKNSPFRTEDEAVQALYKAMLSGLQFDYQSRLGRPMGTFDKPRPNRAEARRSGRSLRNIQLSLEALNELALLLATDHPHVSDALQSDFDRAAHLANNLDDPVFAGVATPQGRLRVEILQQSIEAIRETAVTELGPLLGVAVGFNALDGD